MSPCGPARGGVAWRGCGRREGAREPLVCPGARGEGLGRRWSPPPRPAQQRHRTRRQLPGCMLASAWRSRPGSERLVRPQPSGSGGQPSIRRQLQSRVARATPSLARPRLLPAAAESAASRGSFARRGEGAGLRLGRGSGASAGGGGGGAGSDRPAPPQPHPPASAHVRWLGGGCAQ